MYWRKQPQIGCVRLLSRAGTLGCPSSIVEGTLALYNNTDALAQGPPLALERAPKLSEGDKISKEIPVVQHFDCVKWGKFCPRCHKVHSRAPKEGNHKYDNGKLVYLDKLDCSKLPYHASIQGIL